MKQNKKDENENENKNNLIHICLIVCLFLMGKTKMKQK